LRGRLLAHAVRAGPSREAETAELTTLATRGLDALDAYFARYLPQVLLAALVPLAVLVAVFPADPLAGVTIAATLPLVPVFLGLVGRATEVHSRQQFARTHTAPICDDLLAATDGRTVVLITHRPFGLSQVDEVVRLR